MRKNTLLLYVIFACIFLLPLYGMATEIDGSKTLLCAVTELQNCKESGCQRGTLHDVNLSQFVTIDFTQQIIKEKSGEKRSTPIKHLVETHDQIILQGVEKRAWSVVIGRENGKLSASIFEDDYGFVLFGACTQLP